MKQNTAENSHAARRNLFLFLKLALVAVILLFMVRSFLANWEEVRDRLSFHSIEFLAVSWTAYALFAGFQAIVWVGILRLLGAQASVRSFAPINVVAQVTKYVPGKVWGLLGKVMMARNQGVRVDEASASIVLEAYFWNLTGLWLGAWFALLWPPVEWPWLKAAAIGLLIVIPAFFHPAPQHLAFAIVHKIKPAWNFDRFRLTLRGNLKIAFLCFAGWLVNGLFTWVFIRSLVPVEWTLYAPLLGVMGAAAFATTVVVLAPGGIGVKEGVFAVLLAPFVGGSTAAFLAVAYRLWLLFAEASMVGIAYAATGGKAWRRSQSTTPEPASTGI